MPNNIMGNIIRKASSVFPLISEYKVIPSVENLEIGPAATHLFNKLINKKAIDRKVLNQSNFPNYSDLFGTMRVQYSHSNNSNKKPPSQLLEEEQKAIYTKSYYRELVQKSVDLIEKMTPDQKKHLAGFMPEVDLENPEGIRIAAEICAWVVLEKSPFKPRQILPSEQILVPASDPDLETEQIVNFLRKIPRDDCRRCFPNLVDPPPSEEYLEEVAEAMKTAPYGLDFLMVDKEIVAILPMGKLSESYRLELLGLLDGNEEEIKEMGWGSFLELVAQNQKISVASPALDDALDDGVLRHLIQKIFERSKKQGDEYLLLRLPPEAKCILRQFFEKEGIEEDAILLLGETLVIKMPQANQKELRRFSENPRRPSDMGDF